MTGNRLPHALALLTVLALAACSASAPSSAGASAGSGASSATGAPSTPASALPSASGTGTSSAQTDTEWGRIWDSLPADFPAYPGATPAEETATGAASADLVVTGGDARTIATTMQSALIAAGYATAGLSGPLEDGSFTLDMTGPQTGCKVELRVTPTGGLTSLKILYGASCPNGR
jgi:hypothetical protein